MTPRAMNARHTIVESCALQLHAWKPFQSTSTDPSKSYPFHAKKPCLSDRSTAPSAADTLDLSRLTMTDDPPPLARRDDTSRWFARKRRRRGSRSVSGRSSDRSGTRPLGGASAAYATCSDFVLAAGGTDSSGEMFLNGEGSWGSDVSEKGKGKAKAKDSGLDKENLGIGVGYHQQSFGGLVVELQGNESGYGSEPGYRGDGELGYGDEYDEEEEDGRQLFWGEGIGDTDQMEIVGENKFSDQKTHHRGRRKKHDWRMVAPLR